MSKVVPLNRNSIKNNKYVGKTTIELETADRELCIAQMCFTLSASDEGNRKINAEDQADIDALTKVLRKVQAVRRGDTPNTFTEHEVEAIKEILEWSRSA